jgi:hypothetical protein
MHCSLVCSIWIILTNQCFSMHCKSRRARFHTATLEQVESGFSDSVKAVLVLVGNTALCDVSNFEQIR